MRRELKNTIEYQCTTLEEAVTPIQPVVLHDMMCLGLEPKVERDQSNATDPPRQSSLCHKITWNDIELEGTDLIACIMIERPSGTRKQANANMQ